MEIKEKDRGFDFKIKFSSAGSVHPDAIGRVGGSPESFRDQLPHQALDQLWGFFYF